MTTRQLINRLAGPATIVQGDDLTVEHRGPATQRVTGNAGQFRIPGREVDAIAAGQQCGAVRGDPHDRAIAVPLELIREAQAVGQSTTIRGGQHRLDRRRGRRGHHRDDTHGAGGRRHLLSGRPTRLTTSLTFA